MLPDSRLINFRFPAALVEELEEARSALDKPSVSELVREAIREYIDARKARIQAVRRAKERTSD